MSVKRIPDEHGLRHDGLVLTDAGAAMTAPGSPEWEALVEFTARADDTPAIQDRIERLGRYPLLADQAEHMRRQYLSTQAPLKSPTNALQQLEVAGKRAEWERLLRRLERAESVARDLDSAPSIAYHASHANSIAALREPRGSKMPKLDEWLDNSNLGRSNNELFALLPESDAASDFYRDGAKVIEINDAGGTHSIGRAGFDKRVTAARERQKRR